jgi:hypothetical protein
MALWFWDYQLGRKDAEIKIYPFSMTSYFYARLVVSILLLTFTPYPS